MNKSAWAIAKINLKSIKVPYVITGVLFLVLIVNDIMQIIIGSDVATITSNTLWLIIPLAAILIAAKNFRKIVNLGGKRKNFFAGCFITYLILAAAVSLANILFLYTYDPIIMNTGNFWGTLNLLNIFGWTAHGPIIAFFQQFAFFFLFAVLTHTLTALQDSWVGWVTDILIIAIIAVFTPIEPLRAVLYNFFRMILFHPSFLLQIITCIVLAVGIYALNYPILIRKKI